MEVRIRIRITQERTILELHARDKIYGKNTGITGIKSCWDCGFAVGFWKRHAMSAPLPDLFYITNGDSPDIQYSKAVVIVRPNFA